MIEGIGEGAWVRFTTARVDGENMLTSIQVAKECRRFDKCQQVRCAAACYWTAAH